LTSELVGSHGPVATLAGSFERVRSSFTHTGNVDGSFEGTFEEITSGFEFPALLVASFEAPTASIDGYVGAIGYVAGTLRALDGSFDGSLPHTGSLAASLQALTGSIAGRIEAAGSLAGELRAIQANLQGVQGAVGTLSGTFERAEASLSGLVVLTGTLDGSVPRMVAYFSGEPALAAGLDTWATNTRLGAVTKYPSFPANSLARYNGTYLAAGPTGIYVLEGDSEIEAGATWRVRTGQHDDKRPGLKRMTEVLVGARFSDPIKVRVYTDGSRYYDYALPNYRTEEIQQARVKTGKGLKSRYYQVDLSGTGSRFELDSLQATMPDTTRRVG
jgi:hypothetical protein